MYQTAPSSRQAESMHNAAAGANTGATSYLASVDYRHSRSTRQSRRRWPGGGRPSDAESFSSSVGSSALECAVHPIRVEAAFVDTGFIGEIHDAQHFLRRAPECDGVGPRRDDVGLAVHPNDLVLVFGAVRLIAGIG
jgi:hypothetical protein